MNQSAPHHAACSRTVHDTRWAAVVARDPPADGAFYYSVKTTGVYCRPSWPHDWRDRSMSCFHATWKARSRPAFVPANDAQPNQASRATQQAAIIVKVCRLIEQSKKRLGLNSLRSMLAEPLSLSPLCKMITGLTPKAYATLVRVRLVRSRLTRAVR